MLDILIKSFNRPFYLERCLKSIKTFVEGDYNIQILDDGTPKKYLQKIQEKYPEVKILKSENYQYKALAIEENLKSGKEIDGFTIPTELWYNAVKKASEYFIMTEEDVWFTQKLQINEIVESCKNHHISLLKLGWLGNQKDEEYVTSSNITHNIFKTIPKELLLFPKTLNNWYFYNKYKFFTILYKLGVVDNYTHRKYWSLNSILMGFWQKDYWLFIWKDAKGKVDEKQQLRNASTYYRKHQRNPNFIAKLASENMKTTFSSSATNSYHKYHVDLDINQVNYILNEEWYKGNLNAMENFPNDFSQEYIISFLQKNHFTDIQIKNWKIWVQKFKDQYTNFGCTTD